MMQMLLRLDVPEANLKDIDYIRRLLRTRMVEEWQNNIEYYQGFLTVDLRDIAPDFLDTSHFSGSAGDLMFFTISNILQMPITIFTSSQDMPWVCILPTTSTLDIQFAWHIHKTVTNAQDTMIMSLIKKNRHHPLNKRKKH